MSTPLILTDKERAIIEDLIKIAWNAGAVRGPDLGRDLQALNEKVKVRKEVVK